MLLAAFIHHSFILLVTCINPSSRFSSLAVELFKYLFSQCGYFSHIFTYTRLNIFQNQRKELDQQQQKCKMKRVLHTFWCDRIKQFSFPFNKPSSINTNAAAQPALVPAGFGAASSVISQPKPSTKTTY